MVHLRARVARELREAVARAVGGRYAADGARRRLRVVVRVGRVRVPAGRRGAPRARQRGRVCNSTRSPAGESRVAMGVNARGGKVGRSAAQESS